MMKDEILRLTGDKNPTGKWRRRTIAKVMAELMDMAGANRPEVYVARRAQMAQKYQRRQSGHNPKFKPYQEICHFPAQNTARGTLGGFLTEFPRHVTRFRFTFGVS